MNGLGNKKVMAKNIQHYLELNGKDRNDLCRDLGFKYTTVANWLQGERYPRIDKIEMMARYFGVSKSDLVEEHKAPQPAPDQMTIIRLALKDHPDVLKAIESADFATNTINLGDVTINIDDIDLDYIKTSILSAIVMAKQKGENGKLEITVSPKAKLPDT